MRKPGLTQLENHFGVDKGTVLGDWEHPHYYTFVYEYFLKPVRNKPIGLLEIGVWKGASLRMWEAYLPQAKIVGVDIDPECARYASDRVLTLPALRAYFRAARDAL